MSPSLPDGEVPAFPPLVEPGPPLDPVEIERFSRLALLPEIGLEGIRRLRRARVLVVGAGGLGSPVLLYLTAAGVGHITVIDDDVVELSNLQRQVIHGTADLGRAKVDSAADRIAALSSGTHVQTVEARFTEANAASLVNHHDLVIDGSDNFLTRYLVADACEIANKPVVWGAILQFAGQVSVFWPTYGPTYRDIFPEPPAPGSVPSCGDAGVLPTVCAAIGSAMANEAVKLILGIGQPLVGRLLVHDSLRGTWQEIAIRPDAARQRVTTVAPEPETCDESFEPASPNQTDITRISAAEVAAQMTSPTPPILIDVREVAERDIVSIPGSRSIPLRAIESGDDLRSHDLHHDQEIILYCKAGPRSVQAAESFGAQGFRRIAILDGGVLAWVDAIDPTLPRY